MLSASADRRKNNSAQLQDGPEPQLQQQKGAFRFHLLPLQTAGALDLHGAAGQGAPPPLKLPQTATVCFPDTLILPREYGSMQLSPVPLHFPRSAADKQHMHEV